MSDFYKTCACRQTGILHTLKHRPCEDHTAMSVSPDGCIAITLADGAGSYSKAAEGAQITSTAAAEHLANHFAALWQMPPDQAACSILDAVLYKLSAKAGSTGLSLKEYSSTLLAAAAAPDGRCLLFHVGDGVILGLDRSGGCHILSRYEHDGPDNLTTFVTVPGTTYFIQQSNMHQNGLCAYALTSDGCEVWIGRRIWTRERMWTGTPMWTGEKIETGQRKLIRKKSTSSSLPTIIRLIRSSWLILMKALA